MNRKIKTRKAEVFQNQDLAGILEKNAEGYFFTYDSAYLQNSDTPPISLMMPKRAEPYHSPILFPYFFNMLPEGFNKKGICWRLKIDENDYFTLLLKVAHTETIGAITVKALDHA